MTVTAYPAACLPRRRPRTPWRWPRRLLGAAVALALDLATFAGTFTATVVVGRALGIGV